MNRFVVLGLFLGALVSSAAGQAAAALDLPKEAIRPVRLEARFEPKLPRHDLSDGFELKQVAAAPLVLHPIMGCLDDRGRLFVGDAVGVNWNKAQMDAAKPNRILMLEDRDRDGVFEHSTVFADKMTFPQGCCWLNGSLYVGSPPSLWKLTDRDGDGVADERVELATGFDYTGNAADIHGPFFNPHNGRLYWCHGRKGHRATEAGGRVVDESLACGIWSCMPDGRDLQWHSLGCGDNPVEVDFSRRGDVIGVQNLYYSQPRGDTIVHWLPGGVYERADQLQAIAHVQRSLPVMPVMHNFGHVAVSGCCFWPQWPGAGSAEQFMVTHFNTQRLVRMELMPQGSSYRAVENEFLKLHDPDIHLTDVLVDPRDGSLLLLNTGGWFRIGCPSSLMAKADVLGGIYRISFSGGKRGAKPNEPLVAAMSLKDCVAALEGEDDHQRRRALEQLAADKPVLDAALKTALQGVVERDLDAVLEHSVIHALRSLGAVDAAMLQQARSPSARLLVLRSLPLQPEPQLAKVVESKLALWIEQPGELAQAALIMLSQSPGGRDVLASRLSEWLAQAKGDADRLSLLQGGILALGDDPRRLELLLRMLEQTQSGITQIALQVLSQSQGPKPIPAMESALRSLWQRQPSALLLDVLKRAALPGLDADLATFAADDGKPLVLRLKAMAARSKPRWDESQVRWLRDSLVDPKASASARIAAAGLLAAAPLDMLEPSVLEQAGPVELRVLLPLVKRQRGAALASWVGALARNPSLVSLQESHYRTALADAPPESFEKVLLPAYRKGVAGIESKRRALGELAAAAATQGDARRGRELWQQGKGTCLACHKIGDYGRAVGPDLSHIGAIRSERDLLESILFPSSTLARDYEAHAFETRDGGQVTGVIRSHSAEGLIVVDLAGVEHVLRHDQILSQQQLEQSLMPMGLDMTLQRGELLDLVAFLRSLR